MSLTDKEKAIRRKLRDDFPHYAAKCLKIRTKAGSVEPFVLNEAQRYLHERLEKQKADIGKVRALVLKGRQQGISTYVGGRYYHKATHTRGRRVFILTHEQDATNNLFGMVERYHEHCPALVKPATGAANAKELSFAKLESGYLTTPAVHYLGVVNWPLPPDEIAAQHAAAFLIGVSAMWISDALFEYVARRFKSADTN